MKNIKKWASGILAILMIITCIPINALEIPSNSSNNTNQESEEEFSSDNWNLDLCFLDTDINNGKTPLYEFNYEATDYQNFKSIILQITYKNDSTVTSYSPGELNITLNLPQLYDGTYMSVTQATAGSVDDGYDWNYKLIDKNSKIVFYNNISIEEGKNFEGSLQFALTPDPRYVSNNYSFDFSAKLSDSEKDLAGTDSIPFIFTSNRLEMVIKKTATKIKAYDGLPEGAENYIWVKWNVTFGSTGQGVRNIEVNYADNNRRKVNSDEAKSQSLHILEYVPDNAIVTDNEGNILENNNGIVDYKIDTSYSASGLTFQKHIFTYSCSFFIGYPIDEYSDQKVTNKIEAYGIYWDEDEETLLCSDEETINTSDFIFTGSGTGLSQEIRKNGISYVYVISSLSKTTYSNVGFYFTMDTNYYGKTMDIEICDDVLTAPNENNDYEILSDEDYYYTYINWPGDRLLNVNEQVCKPYTMELYVRYKDSDTYELYRDDLIANQSYQKTNATQIDFPEGVVGWKIIIKDVVEGLCFRRSASGAEIRMNICKKDIADSGNLYNFMYMQEYVDGEPTLFTTEDYYATKITKEKILEYDLEHYNAYLKRTVGSLEIHQNIVACYLQKTTPTSSTMTNNTSKERFEGTYRISFQVNPYGLIDEFPGYYVYDLLPEGMEADEITLNKTISSGLKTATGIDIDYDYYLRHSKVEIINNWNNTNRTLVRFTADFTYDPLALNNSKAFKVSFDMNVFVTYDNYLDYGSSYSNTAYMQVMDTSGEYYEIADVYGRINQPNMPKDILDLNENGENEIFPTCGTATMNIINLIGSHQDVQTQVQSSISNFSTGYVDAEYDDIYTYKLKIRLGQNDATSLIIYDNLEEAFGKNKHWQGEFLGVDTSYLDGKQYMILAIGDENADENNEIRETIHVKTYYSENPDAGTLSEDNSWKEYNDEVDKTKVKSLAFELLDENNNPAIIPAGSSLYVLINMKAPADESIITLAYNSCWTQWTAIDEFRTPVNFITGINSNIVKVALPNSVKRDSLPLISINFTKEINSNDEAFENMQLDKDAEYNFIISLVNTETGNTYNGLLNNKKTLTFSNLQEGTYEIIEIDNNYFDFVEMLSNNDEELIIEGVTFSKEDGKYLLIISDEIIDDITYNIKVINKIEDNHYYEEKEEKPNLFFVNKI